MLQTQQVRCGSATVLLAQSSKSLLQVQHGGRGHAPSNQTPVPDGQGRGPGGLSAQRPSAAAAAPQIVDCARYEDHFVVHDSINFSTSSTSVPSPRSSCAKPSRTPATNSTSRAICCSETSSGSRESRSETRSLLLMGEAQGNRTIGASLAQTIQRGRRPRDLNPRAVRARLPHPGCARRPGKERGRHDAGGDDRFPGQNPAGGGEDIRVVAVIPEVQPDGQSFTTGISVFIRREMIHPPAHSCWLSLFWGGQQGWRKESDPSPSSRLLRPAVRSRV